MPDDEHSRTVQRTVDAPAAAVFAILADPARHADLDGSGTVLGLVSGGPIRAVGDRFRMSMDRPGRADYRSDNVVVLFEPGVAVGWATADLDEEPPGYTWSFRITPVTPQRCTVAHTYDWAAVTDPALLRRFPQVSPEEMSRTLDRLAATVS
jgi:hypothetical protein